MSTQIRISEDFQCGSFYSRELCEARANYLSEQRASLAATYEARNQRAYLRRQMLLLFASTVLALTILGYYFG